ncbi:MAG: hypothetical protein D6732_29025 [Methanobacteriota archaeon]|nr:MAG: hypothetical protein D6732_29025 [Euryarchaeota archaeon]
MLADIGFVILIGVIIWLMGAIVQRFSPRNKVFVPLWLALLSGKLSNDVDRVGFSVQLFGLGFVIWFTIIFLFVPPGEQRLLWGQRGCLFILAAVFLYSILLSRISKKDG